MFDPLAVSTDLGGKVDEREHHREEGAVAVGVDPRERRLRAAPAGLLLLPLRRREHARPQLLLEVGQLARRLLGDCA